MLDFPVTVASMRRTPSRRAALLALPLLCASLSGAVSPARAAPADPGGMAVPPPSAGADADVAAPGALVLDTPAIAVRNLTHLAYQTVAKAGPRLVAGGEHGVIALSDDGGATWRQAKVPVSAAILSIAFATPQVGWAIGSFGVVLRSTDAGASWTLMLDGTRTGPLMAEQAKLAPAPAAAAVPGPAAQVAAAKASAPDGNDPSSFIPGALPDPGASATDSGVPPRLRRAQSFIKDGPDKPFFVLQAIDADHARVIGGYDMAFETSDGGKTWTEWDQRIDNKGDLHPYGLAGTDADTILVGEQGLLLKGDPATEMKVVQSPYEGSYFGALDAGKSGLFIFGLLGHLYRSTDGGSSWPAITNKSQSTLTSGLMLKDGGVLFSDLQGSIWRLDGDTLIRTAASRPFPVTQMVEDDNGDIVVSGLGGLQRVAKQLIATTPQAGG